MKTKITTYYQLQNKCKGRWAALDARYRLRDAKTMLQLFKTSGLWKGERLRVVKLRIHTMTKTTKQVVLTT